MSGEFSESEGREVAGVDARELCIVWIFVWKDDRNLLTFTVVKVEVILSLGLVSFANVENRVWGLEELEWMS